MRSIMIYAGTLAGIAFQCIFLGWLFQLSRVIGARKVHPADRWVYSPGPPIAGFFVAYLPTWTIGEKSPFLLGVIAGSGITAHVLARAARGKEPAIPSTAAVKKSQ